MSEARAIRVMVGDVWDELKLSIDPSSSVGTIKARALTQAKLSGAAEDYLVKFRGAEVRDEDRTIAEVGVPENGAMIILQRRRRVVR